MIDYTTGRAVIEKHLKDNFTTCGIKYENVPLDVKGRDSWIAVFDKPAVSTSLEFGDDTPYLSGGSLIINIFTPLDIGTKLSRAIAQELANLIGQKELGGFIFQEPELHPVVSRNEATWYQVNLVIPYQTVMGQSADIC